MPEKKSRIVYNADYILPSLQRQFFTRHKLAAYLTQPLLAVVDRRIIRSRPIKGSRRVYTYIYGTFVLSRNGIIVCAVGTRYFDYAECTLSRLSAHACNSSLIAAAELYHTLATKKI